MQLQLCPCWPIIFSIIVEEGTPSDGAQHRSWLVFCSSDILFISFIHFLFHQPGLDVVVKPDRFPATSQRLTNETSFFGLSQQILPLLFFNCDSCPVYHFTVSVLLNLGIYT
jgi:hypothetical protein